MTIPVNNCALSAEEARALTDEAKAGADVLWSMLLRLYHGEAWKALKYKSWGAYFEAELGGGSARRGYQLLNAGRVLDELEDAGFRGEGSPGSPVLNEATARELAPILRNGGDAVREAYEEALESAGGSVPTAKQVRAVVQRHDPEPTAKQVQQQRTPSWALRLQLLAGELRTIATSPPSDTRDDHCRTARELMPGVLADLEWLESGTG